MSEFSKFLDLAQDYSKKGKAKKSIECWKKVVHLKPTFGEAWILMGEEYEKLNDAEKALDCYDKALTIRPYEEARWNKDQLLKKSSEQKLTGNGETNDKKMPVNESDEYIELFNKGTIALNNERNFQKAMKYYQEALKLVDNDPELFLNMGSAYSGLGEIEKSRAHFKRALDIDPHEPKSLLNMAILDAKEGEFDRAIETLNTLFEFNPDFAQARPILMQIKRQKEFFSIDVDGKAIPEKALNLFKQGIKFTNQNTSKAIELFKAAIDKYPQFAQAYYVLGNIEFVKNNHEKALEHYEIAIKLKPDYYHAWNFKGLILDQKEQYEKALECFDRSLAIKTNSSAYNNKGLALDRLERYEEAIECFTKSIELNPDYEGAYYNRATTYKKINQLERAIADYKKTLDLNPYHENAKEQIDYLKHWSLRGVEGTQRSVVDSRDYCSRCGKKLYTETDICPYCSTSRHLEDIEDLLRTVVEEEANGNFERVLMLLVKINERDPTNGPAWLYRGKAHCALGEFQNAVMCFGKCQQLGYNPIQKMMYGLTAKNNIENFKRPDLSPEHLAKVELKPSGYFLDEKSWTINGAVQQMLMQYEQAYKCYQKALEHKHDYLLAKKNMEIIEKLANK